MTAYPSAVDYSLALQHPDTAFTDAHLRAAKLTQGLLGPYGIAGSSAVVFHGEVGGEDCALRCYTREDASTPERYALLSEFVKDNGLSEHVGGVTWYQQAVRVKGARWPVLKMAWIEGRQLNEYAAFLAGSGNNAALRTLAERWLELVNVMQAARFAHGDLQHGNILVDQQQQLRLVDFDSVWIPQLQGQEPPTESGHTSYQSRSGAGASRWGPYMDTFSGLVIYLALTALAKDPGMWAEFDNGDNLLFERDDFGPPYETGIWNRLAGLSDPEIDRIAGKLKDCCAPDWVASRSLKDTLARTWWEHEPPAPAVTPTSAADSVTGTATTGSSVPAEGEPTASAPGAGQPAPSAGSLPPPPAVPYQSPVAPQSGMPSTIGSGGPWYKQQQQSRVPAPTAKSTAAKKRQRRPALVAGRILSALLLVAAITAGVIVGIHPWTHPPVLEPTGLTVQSGTTSDSVATDSVEISWSGPVTGPLPDDYAILRNGTQVATVSGTTTRYTDNSLTPGTSYRYQVIAVRGGKQSPASAILTAQTSPLRPTGLTVERTTTNTVEVAWSGPATGPPPGKYEILRDGADIATVSGSTTRYLDRNLAPDTAYTYQVIAVTGGKMSQASATLTSAHTTKPPLSAAVLDWSGQVTEKMTSLYPAAPDWPLQPGSSTQDTWTVSPDCPSGPCDATLAGAYDGWSYTTKLLRSGRTYSGTTELKNYYDCVLAPSELFPATLSVSITVNGAGTQGLSWTATSFSGNETINAPAVNGCVAVTGQFAVTSS